MAKIPINRAPAPIAPFWSNDVIGFAAVRFAAIDFSIIYPTMPAEQQNKIKAKRTIPKVDAFLKRKPDEKAIMIAINPPITVVPLLMSTNM